MKMEREILRNMFTHTTNRTGDRTTAYGLSLQLSGPTDPALISADPSGLLLPFSCCGGWADGRVLLDDGEWTTVGVECPVSQVKGFNLVEEIAQQEEEV